MIFVHRSIIVLCSASGFGGVDEFELIFLQLKTYKWISLQHLHDHEQPDLMISPNLFVQLDFAPQLWSAATREGV